MMFAGQDRIELMYAPLRSAETIAGIGELWEKPDLRIMGTSSCFRHWDTLGRIHRILLTRSCSSVHLKGIVSH